MTDFVVEVEPPIDARDSNTYIWVNQIFYPTTLSNVNKINENYFYFQLTFQVENFVKNESNILLPSTVDFEFDKVMIPQGFYDAKMICCVLNKYLSQFGMNFFCGRFQNHISEFQYVFQILVFTNKKSCRWAYHRSQTIESI